MTVHEQGHRESPSVSEHDIPAPREGGTHEADNTEQPTITSSQPDILSPERADTVTPPRRRGRRIFAMGSAALAVATIVGGGALLARGNSGDYDKPSSFESGQGTTGPHPVESAQTIFPERSEFDTLPRTYLELKDAGPLTRTMTVGEALDTWCNNVTYAMNASDIMVGETNVAAMDAVLKRDMPKQNAFSSSPDVYAENGKRIADWRRSVIHDDPDGEIRKQYIFAYQCAAVDNPNEPLKVGGLLPHKVRATFLAGDAKDITGITGAHYQFELGETGKANNPIRFNQDVVFDLASDDGRVIVDRVEDPEDGRQEKILD